MNRTIATLFFLFPVLAACSGTGLVVGSDKSASTGEDGGGADAGGCTTNADCGAKKLCGFVVQDACGATGSCFDAPDLTCAAYSPGCACDGTPVNLACNGLPSGYASKPVAHAGDCGSETDGGGGAADGGGPCVDDTDCGGPSSGFYCGYPKADACQAQGRCLYVGNVGTCAAFSPGCACDGSEINIICTPLPDGYASKPLAHEGACNDAGK